MDVCATPCGTAPYPACLPKSDLTYCGAASPALGKEGQARDRGMYIMYITSSIGPLGQVAERRVTGSLEICDSAGCSDVDDSLRAPPQLPAEGPRNRIKDDFQPLRQRGQPRTLFPFVELPH